MKKSEILKSIDSIINTIQKDLDKINKELKKYTDVPQVYCLINNLSNSISINLGDLVRFKERINVYNSDMAKAEYLYSPTINTPMMGIEFDEDGDE